MATPPSPFRLILIVAAAAMLASACSASFSIGGKSVEDAAVEVIEGEIAEQIGQDLTATCPEVADPADGVVFECEAATADGQVAYFNATIDEEAEMVDVVSVNVLGPDEVEALESSAEAVLTEQVGVELPDGSFECGDGPMIVPDSGDLDCSLTDPGNGDVYDAIMTVELSDGSFDIQIADEPRP